MDEWIKTINDLPKINDKQIEMIFDSTSNIVYQGMTSIVDGSSPFLILGPDNTYWRCVGPNPELWHYITK
jgi:hypothetical protein